MADKTQEQGKDTVSRSRAKKHGCRCKNKHDHDKDKAKGHHGRECKDRKIEELTHTLKCVQADLENYRKRVERDMIEFRRYASQDIIMSLLPVMDNLGMALRTTSNPEEFHKGIEMISQQFKEILRSNGVGEIEAEGKDFDPKIHEAVSKEPGEADNKVLEELQKGYRMHDRILRHAKVKVSTTKKDAAEERLDKDEAGKEAAD